VEKPSVVDEGPGDRHRHPGAQAPWETLPQQPGAEQRDQDRPDGDDHRGGAGVHLTLAQLSVIM